MLKEQEQAVIERILSRAGLLSEYYNKAVAKVLVEAGYRKAYDVRKETAKEILQWLYNLSKGNFSLNASEVRQIAKDHGVEVDE